MSRGFSIELPGLRCDVAERAAVVRHDFLQNWILNCLDDSIVARFRVAADVHRLATTARLVADGLRDFSGEALVAAVPPLESLPAAGRATIAAKTALAFERAFDPCRRAGLLRGQLEALLRAGARAATAAPPHVPALVGEVRAAAAALHASLGELPRGFWIPYPDAIEA